MILQCKRLKNLLKKYNITDDYGKLSVKIERIRRKTGDVEYGNAIAHVRELTKEEILNLITESKYLYIFTCRGKNGFSVVKSSGSKIIETTFEELENVKK